ncbi:unnamed protein product [Lepeophtheirus salmonis]|uniref:(salmon louse) hypothetical protein n=1 Tax=Lepeophtheirus salmonis TaxID=72036 RepID=A0A7R8CHP4_LEPSM|nr:unnamed protein product [Lepeophtheirus salmonis]CAF2770089.1 unnamed protein product [Lepeophtheirus salmonis]
MPHGSASRSRSSSTSSSSSDPYYNSRKKKSSRHSRHKYKKRNPKKSSKKSSRRRSPSFSPDRRRKNKYPKDSPPPIKKNKKRSSSSPDHKKSVPSPKRFIEENIVLSEADRLKRNKDIETSYKQYLESQTHVNKESVSTEFGFGTSVEKKILKTIDSEGLCHPKLFANAEQREEMWLQRLFRLRKELMADS